MDVKERLLIWKHRVSMEELYGDPYKYFNRGDNVPPLIEPPKSGQLNLFEDVFISETSTES